MGARKIIITCEHGGNYVPKVYELLFVGNEEMLASHRGWDPGALGIAKYLSKHLAAPLYYQKVSRLLVDINRSEGHNQMFSEFTSKLDDLVKKTIRDKYYKPYRSEVEEVMRKIVQAGDTVVHLSVHTFTPELNGIKRIVDVGILYDEHRPEEQAFANLWAPLLKQLLPDKVIMHNCPYHGADDGFTTYLRTKFSDDLYMGIEIEINQKYVETENMAPIKKAMAESLSMLCGMAAI